MSDRAYQETFKSDVRNAWSSGHRNVCGVMPTGAGKSYTVGEIVKEHGGTTVVIAHRQELVGQLSMSIASNGVQHQIIAPDKVRNFIMGEHLRELKVNMVNPNARVAVVGVDTLIRRTKQYSRLMAETTMWIQDECHHLLKDNKWGKVCAMMPNALGLGVTATPIRADGLGLGRNADGVMDVMVEGPTMRELIDAGFLTDYRIFAPPSDVDYSHVEIGSTGDLKFKQLKSAVKESHLVGDVVEHYKRLAMGKLGITFATDVETATDIATQFNAAGVPAEVISAKTPSKIRAEIIRRFKARDLLQLVNVDLFGEGFDLPAIEVVSMARRTLSYSLFSQQFGRALRPMPGKEWATIIDHAGNVRLHGLPDKERIWSLDSREKRPACKNPDDDIPLRYCIECTQPYERILVACPWCGHFPVPVQRDGPEHVDGDLHELTPDVLAAMRSDVDAANESPTAVANRMRYAGAPEVAWRSAAKRVGERQAVQSAARESIAWFAHIQKTNGRTDRECYRMFYHQFGIDVLSAQALNGPDSLVLANKINDYIGKAG